MGVHLLDAAPYLPAYRLSGETTARTWGGRPSPQARTVANWDEDTITMAYEALAQIAGSGNQPRALYFASANPPHLEKSCADLLVAALDLSGHTRTADFGGSARSATQALRGALDALGAGGGTVAVVAAEQRLAVPGSPLELQMGDGAVALTLGDGPGIAEVVAADSWSDEFTDTWRLPSDRYTQMGDARFVQEQGYERTIKAALSILLEAHSLTVGELGGVAFAGADGRAHQALGARLGCRPEQIADPALFRDPGHLGTAASFLSLLSVLERTEPGKHVILCGYGSGVDLVLLKTSEGLRHWQEKRRLAIQRERAKPLPTYGHYLAFRRLIDGERIVPFSSLIMAWREQESNLRRHGNRCRACGIPHFPPHNACPGCGSRDGFDKVRLSERGTIITFNTDQLAPSPDAPVTMAVVDLDGGGRMFAQLVDASEADIAIGKRAEFVFRRYHEGAGTVNYFWKFRPERRG